MPVPATLPLKHYRGDTLTLTVKLWNDASHSQPTNLTGATVLAQVRSNPDSDVVITTFGSSITGSQITLTLTPAQTALLPEEATYDVQVTYSNNVVQTVLAGELTAEPDVSHP